jgi:hypothetical protein
MFSQGLTIETVTQKLWFNIFMGLQESLAKVWAQVTQGTIYNMGYKNQGLLICVGS